MVTNPAAREFLASEHRHLIGDKWLPSASGETIVAEDPATGEQIGEIPAGSKSDIDLAVAEARRTFDERVWRGMSGLDRAAVMLRMADLILEHADALAELETLDNGMPLNFVRYTSDIAAEAYRHYAGLADKAYGRSYDMIRGGGEFHAYTRLEPVGVIASITPWNGPFAMACTSTAPALAAGCSVVVKPAEQASLTTLYLGRLFLEAGVPPGVINIVTGYGPVAGAALVDHPDVDKVNFTGSSAVGKHIARSAADTLKRVTLELGGKSPVFIFDDADLEVAIPRAAMGIFANSGQVCYAGSRLYVQEGVYDKVVAGIADFARNIKVGSGFDPENVLGPLISAKQLAQVERFVELGLGQGAELVTGGARIGTRGYFFQPTVFAGVDDEMTIAQDEIFGPVLSVLRFKGMEDLERLANNTDYGLAAGVYTSNLSTAHRAAKLIRAGTVWINCYGEADRGMPFGGFKQSGLGRGGGPEGFQSYFEHQSVVIKI